MSLQIKKFDPSTITFRNTKDIGSQAPVIAVIGPCTSYNSFLIKDLLYHFQDVPICTVISGTKALLELDVFLYVNEN